MRLNLCTDACQITRKVVSKHCMPILFVGRTAQELPVAPLWYAPFLGGSVLSEDLAKDVGDLAHGGKAG